VHEGEQEEKKNYCRLGKDWSPPKQKCPNGGHVTLEPGEKKKLHDGKEKKNATPRKRKGDPSTKDIEGGGGLQDEADQKKGNRV